MNVILPLDSAHGAKFTDTLEIRQASHCLYPGEKWSDL